MPLTYLLYVLFEISIIINHFIFAFDPQTSLPIKQMMDIFALISLDNVLEQDAVFAKKLKILLAEEDASAGDEDLLQLRSEVHSISSYINTYCLLVHHQYMLSGVL